MLPHTCQGHSDHKMDEPSPSLPLPPLLQLVQTRLHTLSSRWIETQST